MNGQDKADSSSEEPCAEANAMEHEAPFSVWLSRSLHQIFDSVVNEPIPEELLKLIENDRNR